MVFRIPSGKRARIESLVVDAGARGRGVGRALCLAAMDRARALGADCVDLTSLPAREAANRLYAALGFQLRPTNVYRHRFSPGLRRLRSLRRGGGPRTLLVHARARPRGPGQ